MEVVLANRSWFLGMQPILPAATSSRTLGESVAPRPIANSSDPTHRLK